MDAVCRNVDARVGEKPRPHALRLLRQRTSDPAKCACPRARTAAACGRDRSDRKPRPLARKGSGLAPEPKSPDRQRKELARKSRSPARQSNCPAFRPESPARKPAGPRTAALVTPIASRNALRARDPDSRPDQNGRASNETGRRSDRRGRSPALFRLRARLGPLRASLATSCLVGKSSLTLFWAGPQKPSLHLLPLQRMPRALIIAGGRLQGEDASGGRLGARK